MNGTYWDSFDCQVQCEELPCNEKDYEALLEESDVDEKELNAGTCWTEETKKELAERYLRTCKKFDYDGTDMTTEEASALIEENPLSVIDDLLDMASSLMERMEPV